MTLVLAGSILRNMGSKDPRDCRRLVLVDDATSQLQRWPAYWQGLDEWIDSLVAGFLVESEIYFSFFSILKFRNNIQCAQGDVLRCKINHVECNSENQHLST